MAPLSSMVENDDEVKYVLFSSFKYKGGGEGGDGSRINGETRKFRHKMINGEGAINGVVGKNLQRS